MPQTLLEQWMQKASQARQAGPSLASTTREGNQVDDRASPRDVEQSEDTEGRSAPTLHAKIRLYAPEKDDIPKFKRLNSLILPIPYPESFYKEIIIDEVANSLTLLAFWNDSEHGNGKGQLVGAIRCRLLRDAASTSPLLYISTLVVLAPYRSLGIASSMLDVLIKRGFEDYGATKVGAHVWEDNTSGLEWYAKRGFTETGFEKDYYRKLDPHGAKVVSRAISALDIVTG